MPFQQPPTSVIGIIEYRTHVSLESTDHHEQLLIKPNNDYLRIESLYEPPKEGILLSSQKMQVLLDCHTEERWYSSDLAIHIALKECDVVVLTWETYEPIRGTEGEGDLDVEQ